MPLSAQGDLGEGGSQITAGSRQSAPLHGVQVPLQTRPPEGLLDALHGRALEATEAMCGESSPLAWPACLTHWSEAPTVCCAAG